jgi:heme/copper-type cytochrome/quinol oxidase subunit 4
MKKRMFQGAAIGLTVISFFLIGSNDANAQWSTFWVIRPLIIVPVAGALGGVYYYYMDHLRHQGGWKNILAIFLSLIGYVVILWLGIVLGLAGTMWD